MLVTPNEEELADAPQGYVTIQRDLFLLEKWFKKNLTRFNEGMGQVPTTPGTSIRWAMVHLGVLVDVRLSTSQQRRPTVSWDNWQVEGGD